MVTSSQQSTERTYINPSFNHSKIAIFPQHQHCILPTLTCDQVLFFKVKIISPNTIFTTFHVHCTYIKLFHKMSSGVGALKVEGPIVQKGSIALEVTMATKQPTSQHHHTETVQWNT